MPLSKVFVLIELSFEFFCLDLVELLDFRNLIFEKGNLGGIISLQGVDFRELLSELLLFSVLNLPLKFMLGSGHYILQSVPLLLEFDGRYFELLG